MLVIFGEPGDTAFGNETAVVWVEERSRCDCCEEVGGRGEEEQEEWKGLETHRLSFAALESSRVLFIGGWVLG